MLQEHFLAQSQDRIQRVHRSHHYQICGVLYVDYSEKLGLAAHRNVELVELLTEVLDR